MKKDPTFLINDIADTVCIVSFSLLVFIWGFHEIFDEGSATMDSTLQTILVSLVSSLFGGGLVAIVSYKKWIGKNLDERNKELARLMEPANNILHEDYRELVRGSTPSNSVLSAEHEKLRSYLEADAKRNAVADDRYKRLDADQRGIVDSVKKLGDFAGQMQVLQEKYQRLEHDYSMAQGEIQHLRAELNRTHAHSRDRASQSWDMEL